MRRSAIAGFLIALWAVAGLGWLAARAYLDRGGPDGAARGREVGPAPPDPSDQAGRPRVVFGGYRPGSKEVESGSEGTEGDGDDAAGKSAHPMLRDLEERFLALEAEQHKIALGLREATPAEKEELQRRLMAVLRAMDEVHDRLLPRADGRAAREGVGVPEAPNPAPRSRVPAPDPNPNRVKTEQVPGRPGISGRITTWYELPLEGEIRAYRVGAERLLDADAIEGATAVPVGPDGRFERDLQPGIHGLVIEAERFVREALEIEVAPELRTAIEIPLYPNLSLRGRIGDESGLPVAGARVEYGGRRAETGLDGAFELAGLDPRTAGDTLLVQHPVYARVEVLLEVTRPAKKRRPSVAPAFVKLVRGCVLRGRVFGPAGSPVAGVELELDFGAARAWSGPDGSWELRSVAPGVHSVLARQAKLAAQDRFECPAPGFYPRDIQLQETASLECEVRGSGEVLGRGTIAFPSIYCRPIDPGRRPITTGLSGFDRSVRVDGLIPGEWEISAHGLDAGSSAPQRVYLGPGEKRKLVFVLGKP